MNLALIKLSKYLDHVSERFWEVLGDFGRLPNYLMNLIFTGVIEFWDLPSGRFWEFLGDPERFWATSKLCDEPYAHTVD